MGLHSDVKAKVLPENATQLWSGWLSVTKYSSTFKYRDYRHKHRGGCSTLVYFHHMCSFTVLMRMWNQATGSSHTIWPALAHNQ